MILTDDSGNWFDKDTAEEFCESTRFNGNNRISIATGSQWDHQSLYRTKKGEWILHNWSQRQGVSEDIRRIEEHLAFTWLIKNDYSQHVPALNLSELEL
jgi:hypothetical protein